MKYFDWIIAVIHLYFTDHPEELGRLVTEGRRNEFRHFSAFADPDARDRIPDPQAASTFESCRLRWEERDDEPHASIHRLYQRLLALRRSEPAIRDGRFEAFAIGERTLLLRQDADGAPSLLAVIAMRGSSDIELGDQDAMRGLDPALCQVLFTTEDRPFAPEPLPPAIDLASGIPRGHFHRPSAVLLSMWPAARHVERG